MKRFYGSVLAVLFPILVLGGLVIQREVDLHKGKILILPIGGYDPRDLLSGHYLQFRIDREFSENVCTDRSLVGSTDENGKNETTQLKTTENGHCVCFQEQEPYYASTIFLPDCTKAEIEIQKCWVVVKGECRYGQFEYPFRKFYIPEDKAKELEAKLQKPGAKIQLRMDQDGKGLIEKIIWPDESEQ